MPPLENILLLLVNGRSTQDVVQEGIIIGRSRNIVPSKHSIAGYQDKIATQPWTSMHYVNDQLDILCMQMMQAVNSKF